MHLYIHVISMPHVCTSLPQWSHNNRTVYLKSFHSYFIPVPTYDSSMMFALEEYFKNQHSVILSLIKFTCNSEWLRL